MNILIVGLGSIGKAYLKGILDSPKKTKIYCVDKKKNKLTDEDKIILSNKLPKNTNFKIVIISTDVRDRLKIIKKIFDNKNKVDNLILEKYIFKSIGEFNYFEENLITKVRENCFVNCWGKIIMNRLGIKPSKESFKMEIDILPNAFLTSFIHFYQMYYYLAKSNKNSVLNVNIKNKFKSKRKFYIESEGFFNTKSKHSSLNYKSKKINTDFLINIKFKSRKYIIKLEKNFKVSMKKNKDSKSIIFPLTKNLINIFINNLEKKGKFIFPKYKEINWINKKILFSLKNDIKGDQFT
tara:strand:- start:113 stop:997 length:885 start_codon:yes stop_codon:yes gene_type:complete